MTRKIHWISSSKDKKTGEVLASYSPIETCPDSCNLKSGGCYAWGLFYLKSLGAKISDGRLATKTLKEAIKNISPKAKIARHRIAGDIVGDAKGTLSECKEIESMGLINIGYTHNWRSKESQPLKKYFRASCNSMEEVLEARKKGWATTIIVPKNTGRVISLANGELAYNCPARHGVPGKKDITCNTCTLCRVDNKTRAKTVMFEVHGNAATLKKINEKAADIVVAVK